VGKIPASVAAPGEGADVAEAMQTPSLLLILTRRFVMAAMSASTQQSNIWWHFILHGLAAIILGLMFAMAHGATLLLATTFLGFCWLIGGALSLVRMFVDRSVPWIWSLLGGTVGILGELIVLGHTIA
jgi:uncharacterized membrane protein HdeD (DUF308 family)